MSVTEIGVTIKPRLGVYSSNPSCTRDVNASRMGVLLTLKRSRNWFSLKGSPGANLQVMISCLICLYTCCRRTVSRAIYPLHGLIDVAFPILYNKNIILVY